MPRPKFPLGQMVATPGALNALAEAGEEPLIYLSRHIFGDWDEVGEDDKKENEFSLKRELRILSAYKLSSSVKIWIITEADRSATTILLPEEY